jgi:hypothetical protein
MDNCSVEKMEKQKGHQMDHCSEHSRDRYWVHSMDNCSVVMMET